MVIHRTANRLVTNLAHGATRVVLGVITFRGKYLSIADLLSELLDGGFQVADLLCCFCEDRYLVLADRHAR